VTASVNKKQSPQLIQALIEAVEMPARLRDPFQNASQKIFCSSVLISVRGMALDSVATCPRRRLSWPPRAGCPCLPPDSVASGL
jgi:hypothetical protein